MQFKKFNTIGEEELAAVQQVVQSGTLSDFIGASGATFLGGKQVRTLEEEACKVFEVQHCISVNSWTSGLITAIGAIDIQPGDEVIVTPWTMVASATCILHWNAIPVFADIDPSDFNLCLQSVRSRITSRTRAIVAVDIFGQSCNVAGLRELATEHGLKLVGDTAQAPGAFYENRPAGTLYDIGGFSLNYHKHIHCGEGGLIVTNDAELAERCQLIRNHAEAVINSDSSIKLSNMVGYNFRLGEMEAAIARVQLKKLNDNVRSRQIAAEKLTERLDKIPDVHVSRPLEGRTHAYYVLGMQVNWDNFRITRSDFLAELKSKGVDCVFGGYQNIHLNPVFKNRIAFGKNGFPWTGFNGSPSPVSYEKGSCPNAEQLHDHTFVGIAMCMYQFDSGEVEYLCDTMSELLIQNSLASVS